MHIPDMYLHFQIGNMYNFCLSVDKILSGFKTLSLSVSVSFSVFFSVVFCHNRRQLSISGEQEFFKRQDGKMEAFLHTADKQNGRNSISLSLQNKHQIFSYGQRREILRFE
ncbi:hypothetical protein GOODEAATRI_000434 [Goodea atripinnis]|uniref:Uncharacterized protein n=1 Tax=Goodea atripinnis TaxID=208336 RepID=A0ABV0PU51_9TELE